MTQTLLRTEGQKTNGECLDHRMHLVVMEPDSIRWQPAADNQILTMQLLLIIYLKTKGMKQIDWKSVALYIIRIIEMLLTGAAGGALVTNL